jgi:RimJ/RimL family protein N-acetyltransferase
MPYMDAVTLTGSLVRLEPLGRHHLDTLAAAAAVDRSIYTWSAVPSGRDAMHAYIETALAARDAGTALAFAIVRRSDDRVAGSTRFFDLESWAPAGEIGYTWLAADVLRSGINREAKFLRLKHAFETLEMIRVCFHTDARNQRSAAALEGIGARFEGVLRAHRLGTDGKPRDSKRYSILRDEWPAVKAYLAAHDLRPPADARND